jgi:hypothetical protein
MVTRGIGVVNENKVRSTRDRINRLGVAITVLLKQGPIENLSN